MAILLKDATFVDWRSLAVRKTHIRVEEGPGGGLGFPDELPKAGPDDRLIDCSGRVVTRSFGCGHHHIYSTLARGMPAPRKVPTNFVKVLEAIWWHLDKRLDLEMIESSALAAAIHCARNGVTFVIDHHASPFAIPGSLETIAGAFDRVGIGHLLCYEISDRDGPEPAAGGLAETDDYLGSRRQGHVGLHASFTVGDDLLKAAVDLAGKHGTGLHVHVAEDQADQDHCLAEHGCRVVERLARAGGLALERSILAHCIHLDENERRLIQDSGVWVAQNTESNLNNNVGITGYTGWAERVILGTDGLHSDMLRSAKAAFLSGQATEGLGFDGIYDRFRAVHRFTAEFGARGDGENNLVILEYDSPTELNSTNFLGHFLFGIEPRHVATVIAAGRVIVDQRRVTGVDEEEVLARSREMGRKLWARM